MASFSQAINYLDFGNLSIYLSVHWKTHESVHFMPNVSLNDVFIHVIMQINSISRLFFSFNTQCRGWRTSLNRRNTWCSPCGCDFESWGRMAYIRRLQIKQIASRDISENFESWIFTLFSRLWCAKSKWLQETFLVALLKNFCPWKFPLLKYSRLFWEISVGS